MATTSIPDRDKTGSRAMTRLEQLRLNLLLTRTELATKAKIDRKVVARIEERTGDTHVASLRKLVNFFKEEGIEVQAADLLLDAATEARA